jgi:formylglycine-generating enzyme required for sulfatase activity
MDNQNKKGEAAGRQGKGQFPVYPPAAPPLPSWRCYLVKLHQVMLHLLLRVVLLLLLLTACASPAVTPSPTATIEPTVPAERVAEGDGVVMVYVAAGEFVMGSDGSEGNEDERPAHTVYLDGYWIDQTEVTNGRYGRCVAAGVCRPMARPRSDMAGLPDHPAQGVTWVEANAYCSWVGRRLPTEAEWEKAARGMDGRLYPWGNDVPESPLSNYDFLVGDVVAVGSYPEAASPYGVLDMAGNVWEWTADWYGEDYYQESPRENPTGPESGVLRVLRGGSWSNPAEVVRATNRFWAFPGRNDFDGFRCAMTEED